MNAYLKHYRQHKIAPTRQDISDIESHVNRRKALYRVLGAPPPLFENRKVLEVGPGGGYNSIVTAQFKPLKYTIVEPNPTGFSNTVDLFKEHHIDMSGVEIINSKIETLSLNGQYDIIICEGLIPGIVDKNQILIKLDTLLKSGGVLILTCVDEISGFFEVMRYYFAHQLTKTTQGFDEKVDIAVRAFGSHLDTLVGMSRLKEDWCADVLFGAATLNNDFSLKICIEFFCNNYYVYGFSPNTFTDFRWYKQLPNNPFEFNQYYVKQFDRKKHNLIHYKVATSDRSEEENAELLFFCQTVVKLIRHEVEDNSFAAENMLISACDGLIKNLDNTHDEIIKAIEEIRNILRLRDYTIEAIRDKYPAFASAFGRGQQYISLLKI